MFDTTRTNIGIFLSRLHFRNRQHNPLQFSGIYSAARTVLVIIPDDQKERDSVIPFLKSLQQKFKGNAMTVVSFQPVRSLFSTLGPCRLVTIHEEQMSFFNYPKRKIVRTLLQQPFDVVIDLNNSFVLSAAYLCRAVDTVLRVGFFKENADSFYNFQCKISSQRNYHARYIQLMKTLAMF